MAHVFTFPDDDEEFANIDGTVGGRAGGAFDDVILVKALLKLIYSHGKSSPISMGSFNVDSRFDQSTKKLISHFQKVDQKRSKPQGFVNRASEESLSKSSRSTLIALQLAAGLVMAGLSGPEVIPYLRSSHAVLQNSLARERESHVISTG
jgi:hypothetical protein